MTFDLTLLQRQPVEVTDVVIGNYMFDEMLHLKRLFVSSGDSQAKRETGSCRQSPPRPHSVPAASQGLRLWLFPQPTCHPWDAPGSWSPHSQRCASARPSAPAAACLGQRQTLGSVCVTAVVVTDTLKVHYPAVNIFLHTSSHLKLWWTF